ncbi:hypothetical protein NDU88_006846 [Pleurodeles waltl]|uniref:Uncharacterized protein n=1 Tax=Pleurodeles waltl TaxID=8319 RepID=A0AAV7QQ57_PLEWA|nr:hypothetical protein NDU88_006846 [Pleurodeles waltl]
MCRVTPAATHEGTGWLQLTQKGRMQLQKTSLGLACLSCCSIPGDESQLRAAAHKHQGPTENKEATSSASGYTLGLDRSDVRGASCVVQAMCIHQERFASPFQLCGILLCLGRAKKRLSKGAQRTHAAPVTRGVHQSPSPGYSLQCTLPAASPGSAHPQGARRTR